MFRYFFRILLGLCVVLLVAALLLPNIRRGREPERRRGCVKHLEQIAVGLLAYADDYHVLPPAYTVDANGKPLHSWRTLILPYIDEYPLYRSIDLKKSWDDPANAEACKTELQIYLCPSAFRAGKLTTYLAIVGPNNCFRPHEPRSLSDIKDAPSETIMVVEVHPKHAVPWMSPMDADEQMLMEIETDRELAHRLGFHAAFVDGHVAFLKADLPANQRRAMVSIAAMIKERQMAGNDPY